MLMATSEMRAGAARKRPAVSFHSTLEPTGGWQGSLSPADTGETKLIQATSRQLG